MRSLFLLLALFAPSLSACEIRLSAAASLANVLRELSRTFERDTKCDVVLNFGASSTLARQIERGAPADLFISADRAKVAHLSKHRLIDESSVRTIATNDLVIVVPRDGQQQLSSPADLLSARFRRIAVARPDSVPAGIYARTYLQRRALWRQLLPKIIPTDNVRTALATVTLGEVDAAFVYATDVRHARGVRVAFRVPGSETRDIRYVAAITLEATKRGGANKLLSFLQSNAARKVFARHGFGVVK